MPTPLPKTEVGNDSSSHSVDATARLRGVFPQWDILGVSITVASQAQALEHIRARVARRLKTCLAFANANLLTLLSNHPRGPQLLSDFLVLNDGVGLDIASKQLYGATFPDNLNGTDFVPALLQALPPETRVFLFGAREEVVSLCAERMAQRHEVNVCGYHHGYTQDFDAVADAVNQARADVVLVALGNPRQEIWITEYAPRVHASLLVGVGALFDFTAGMVTRAPGWVQALRLEFVYRLAQEPRRLAKRYTLDLVEFLWKVRRQKTASASAEGPTG